MPHTYAQNIIHVVFSTKDRRKTISPEFQPKMWAYAAGICKNLGILVHAIGGLEDHIHFLIQVPPTMPLAKAVLAIKSNSSRYGVGRLGELALPLTPGSMVRPRNHFPCRNGDPGRERGKS